jgi:hypothetical protein
VADPRVTRWAVVVSSAIVPKVLRVPRPILDRLGVEVYAVSASGVVGRVS